MYSSIEEEERIDVIQTCYWPLFKLADQGIPIGIEAPGITIEKINELDPGWIDLLVKYINDGKIEFIGSGYSQIIGPLVPAKVNDWNQVIGLEVYKELLGTKPKIALINEMAYSAGILDHYIKNGYKAIIMEWNNPRSGHPEWNNNWRYYPQIAKGTEDKELPLIWSDSIAFQKFQRYAHGEIDLGEYTRFIKTHVGDVDRYFPLYSNDVEIFNYRPGRYQTEALNNNYSEWDRIVKLYQYLDKQDWCEFVYPSGVIEKTNLPSAGNNLRLESAEQPIPVKKQEKYNINRWALTGRNDLDINTKCYKVYNHLINNNTNEQDVWKELCFLWSSDFRTHITEQRWEEYQKRLTTLIDKSLNEDQRKVLEKNDSKNTSTANYEDDRLLTVESKEIKLVLNKNKGLTIKDFYIKSISDKSLFGTLDHGYYDDISLGADYYSGHAVVEIPGEHKITDLNKSDISIYRINDSVSIENFQQNGNYIFKNKILVDSTTLTIKKTLEIKSDKKSIIRPINITFNPEAWDNGSLYVRTHNGDNRMESFYLKGQFIAHGDIYSSLISARHGFGHTEGIFIVGDKEKSITFECNMSVSALIPSIIYKEMDGTFFFRLQYSARELDETLRLNNRRRIIQSVFKIVAN